MISKGTVKYIKSLQLKKYRKKAQSFLVEGAKSVLELIDSTYEITHLLATESFLNENAKIIHLLGDRVALVSEKQLTAVSALKNNETTLAVAKFKTSDPLEIKPLEWVIALDRIRDPGNLGTIIRIADWYGIGKLICSGDCADCYHPKVIQASMGSFLRVQTYYEDLKELLSEVPRVYGAALEGANLHDMEFEGGGVVLIGNESQGLAPDLLKVVNTRIKIPRFGGAESLNAGVAAAVICDNIRRSQTN